MASYKACKFSCIYIETSECHVRVSCKYHPKICNFFSYINVVITYLDSSLHIQLGAILLDSVSVHIHCYTQGIKIQYIGAPQTGDTIAAAAEDSVK